MWKNVPWKTIVGIWLAWVVITLGFQFVVKMRLEDLKRPDNVLQWTSGETTKRSQADKAFLTEPFMNNQVAWDSEFYLAVAVDGYDSPRVRALEILNSRVVNQYYPAETGYTSPTAYSMSYAFFPMYSMLIWVFAWPIQWLGLNPIAAATLAGVMVSALGTLMAMLSLYALTVSEDGHEGGLRAAWYLVIFPMGFFLAMVYTEGLFVGLLFTCLLAIRRKQWWAAGILAGMATLTRSVGGVVFIPLVWAWVQQKTWKEFAGGGKGLLLALGKTLMMLMPLIVYGIWRLSHFGQAFFAVEDAFFARHLLDIKGSIGAWMYALEQINSGNPQTLFFYILEVAAALLGLGASLWLLRKQPAEALVGLVLVLVPLLSGSAQGMPRYVLAVPAIFYLLARWGKNQVFDRAWTMSSILLFGLQAMLFAFDFWVN